MAFKYSTGFKNAVCTANSVKDIFDGGFIKVYSGTVPADANASIGSATLLCTYSNNGTGTGLDLAASAADGSITKDTTQTWKGSAVATGTASFFRYSQTGDAGGADTSTYMRIQGTVGNSLADLNVANTTLTSGQEYVIDAFSLSFLEE